MAAAVERPPSMIPERRGRSPEIIDVDLLADDIVQASRPAQRRRLSSLRSPQQGVITIVDSDEEAEAQAGPSRSRFGQSNNRRIFSPPPPPRDNTVPPVPLLPRHLHSQRSFPMRRHPPPHPSGIVRPNEQPFPFEANIRVGENQADDGPPPPLAVAPPSHHIPAMGFGGALLAMHRPNQVAHPHANHGPGNRPRGRRLPRVQSSWILPSFGDILSGEFMPRRRSAVQEEDIILPPSDDEDAFFDLLTANADDYYHGGRPSFAYHFGRRVRSFEPDYKPAYTHPGKPAPGFIFDFGPPTSESSGAPASTSVIVVDDSPGLSASSSSHNDDPNTILVCARCMDALVTSDSTTGLEHIRRKIWGLRCGHILDGKCIEELMKPTTPAAATAETSTAADVKGKGKEIAAPEPPQLDKGKGKAVEPASELHDELDFLSPPDPNSIRSRLRPRHHSTTSHTSLLPTDIPLSSQRVIRPLPTRRQPAGRGKGKGKTKAALVEAEHHWKCPVAGCAKVHTSLLVEGKWIMDDKAGAIGVYV